MADLNRIRERLDIERRYLARDGDAIHVLPHLTRLIHGSDLTVIWSGLNETNADQAIAQEIARQHGETGSFEWKFYSHDKPADLLSRLQKHGLTAGQSEAVMVYDLSDGPPTCHSEGCRVERITKLEQIEQFRAVAEKTLNLDHGGIWQRLADALANGSTQRIGYVAYHGSMPVSIGRLITHPMSEFGGLYGGTTDAQYRGRGFYRATVAARAADAIRLGARYLLVDALPTSRPILERIGFQRLTDTIPCT